MVSNSSNNSTYSFSSDLYQNVQFGNMYSSLLVNSDASEDFLGYPNFESDQCPSLGDQNSANVSDNNTNVTEVEPEIVVCLTPPHNTHISDFDVEMFSTTTSTSCSLDPVNSYPYIQEVNDIVPMNPETAVSTNTPVTSSPGISASRKRKRDECTEVRISSYSVEGPQFKPTSLIAASKYGATIPISQNSSPIVRWDRKSSYAFYELMRGHTKDITAKGKLIGSQVHEITAQQLNEIFETNYFNAKNCKEKWCKRFTQEVFKSFLKEMQGRQLTSQGPETIVSTNTPSVSSQGLLTLRKRNDETMSNQSPPSNQTAIDLTSNDERTEIRVTSSKGECPRFTANSKLIWTDEYDKEFYKIAAEYGLKKGKAIKAKYCKIIAARLNIAFKVNVFTGTRCSTKALNDRKRKKRLESKSVQPVVISTSTSNSESGTNPASPTELPHVSTAVSTTTTSVNTTITPDSKSMQSLEEVS